MAQTNLRSILFIGGTSPLSFGRFVIEAAAQELQHFDRIAAYHDLSRADDERKRELREGWSASGVEIVTGHGFESPAIFAGFDTVVLILGNHGLYLQPRIIDLAIEAGVKHIYPSEYGADLEVGRNWSMRYYKYKVQTREHLYGVGGKLPQLGWTIFMLGRLVEWTLLPHFGVDNKQKIANIYGSAQGRQSLIATADAAAYVVATLKAPMGPGGHRRMYRISGSSPSYGEIFDLVAEVTGTRYIVNYLEVESAKYEEQEARIRGDVDAELSASHKLIQGLEGTLLPQPWDNERFPEIHPTPLRDALQIALDSEYFRLHYGL